MEIGIYVLCGVLIALMVVLIWRMAAIQREQQRALKRARETAEQQSREILSLNQALSETTQRLGAQSGELSERQDRLRDALDARLEAMRSSSEQQLGEVRAIVSEKLESRLDAMRTTSERQLSEMRSTVSDTLESRLNALRASNESQLGEVRAIVTEKLDARLNESFKLVNRQLADVHAGLGQMRELAGEFADLRRVLGGVKTRGVWGEMQLRSLLEEILAPGQYIENAAIPAGSQTRVEFAVRMPALDGEALLPIDSKFPQEDFLRLTEASAAGDPARIEACAAKLERSLADQAKMISEKYIRPPQTGDFAVMFLPVESLYAEAVRRPGLCERLQSQYRVLVAGPNTLAALLTSLRMGFRSVTLEQRSGEVLKLLAAVRTEFAKYEESVANVRKRLQQTSEAIDAMDVRARKLSRSLRDISEEAGPQ
ncbi:MAG TPA: DNA recombination protein RmuC [Candidatus Faecivicinus avistercoris]|nr:DNA recombination protein RmuC [Candidatus Faecivicinus avistercoris]